VQGYSEHWALHVRLVMIGPARCWYIDRARTPPLRH
jgi:hypothetical protein